jgi:hypothetical protein
LKRKNWSGRQDLTRRESAAATKQLEEEKLVGTAGFEPTTTTPPVWCATRLRYAPISVGILTASIAGF